VLFELAQSSVAAHLCVHDHPIDRSKSSIRADKASAATFFTVSPFDASGLSTSSMACGSRAAACQPLAGCQSAAALVA
jgi:hypothetical protein